MHTRSATRWPGQRAKGWLPLAAALGLLLLQAWPQAVPAARAAPAAREDFVVLVQGAPAGHLVVERGDDGRVQVDYRYRDNGRGPTLREDFRVGPGQRPLTYQVSGQSPMGGAVDEHFEFSADRVRWRSSADQGDQAVQGAPLFLPLEASPAYIGQVVSAVLAAPGQQALVVGGAQLVAERVAQLQLQLQPPLAAGQVGEGGAATVAVSLIAVVGADTDPWYLWLRDDGEPRFFGMTWPGWSVLPAGFEAQAQRLLERQLQAMDARLALLRQRSVQPLPGATLIQAVRWFDAPAAVLRGPSDVWLFDGRIGAITPPGALSAQPDNTIDGQGRTLLPGLWDMHAHLWSDAAALHLAGGVTTVRDLASQNGELHRLMRRIASRELAGPRVVPAGLIEGKSAFSLRNGIVADDLAAALQAVDWYAARGYRQLKLYNSVRPEWVKPIARRAHRLGLRVAGHVPAFMRAEQAVRDGYDELTHINQVMLNFFVGPSDDTRTLLRFTLVGDKARDVALSGAAARRFITLLRQRGTVVDPTLATFEGMFNQADGETDPGLRAIADHLPVLWRRGMLKSGMGLSAAQLARYRDSYARMLQLVGALHRAGIPLVAGTDSVPGLTLHRELELYVKAGIPPAQVLRIATWNAARVAGESERSGSIARGKSADLLLVEGDPTRDISAIRRASLVILGDEAFAPARLFEQLGIRPFAPAAQIQRHAATGPLAEPHPKTTAR